MHIKHFVFLWSCNISTIISQGRGNLDMRRFWGQESGVSSPSTAGIQKRGTQARRHTPWPRGGSSLLGPYPWLLCFSTLCTGRALVTFQGRPWSQVQEFLGEQSEMRKWPCGSISHQFGPCWPWRLLVHIICSATTYRETAFEVIWAVQWLFFPFKVMYE